MVPSLERLRPAVGEKAHGWPLGATSPAKVCGARVSAAGAVGPPSESAAR